MSLARVRHAIEQAELDYYGTEPEVFRRTAEELLGSLRAMHGERVPIGDAVEAIRRLGQMPGVQLSFTHSSVENPKPRTKD